MNIKLNKLAENRLNEKEMNSINGGVGTYITCNDKGVCYACGCSCAYANSGGSSSAGNGNANSLLDTDSKGWPPRE
jgi:natural product precursor